MAESILKWLLPRLAHRSVLTAVLLLTATLSAINGLSTALPQLDDRLMVSLSLLSFGLTWGLAKTRLTARAMSALMVSSGIALLLFYLGQLALPSLKLLLGLSDWLNQIRHTATLDTAPIQPAWQEFSHTLSLLIHRLTDWAQAILHNSPTFDSLIFQLVWGLTSWLGTAWAVWWLRRYSQPLPAILPLGGLLVITCAYRLTDLMPLASLLTATLLLQVLMTYQQHEAMWQRQGLDFSRELQKDVGIAVVPMVLLLTLIATFMPSLSLSFITIPAQQWLYQTSPEINPLANLLGIKPVIKPNNNTVNAARLGGLPRHHLINSSPELSHQTVMLIKIMTPETVTTLLYWRALTYDSYTGHGWLTGAVDTISYDKDEAMPLTPTDTQQILTQEVQLIGATDGFLYVTGSLLKANAAYQVAWRDSGDIFATTTTAKRYQADSLISTATADELRSAATTYPSDIESRYLDLPVDLPARVTTLAHDLTATAPTQYDRALALESYLRTFPYTLNVPTPPLNQDLVDYFLFDLKTGYCDYYATSMVVMARSIGLPARLVVGYAPGTYLPDTYYYVITAAEAHSWAEVYFPGYGWQEFEPTGSSTRPSPRPQTAMRPYPLPYTSTSTVMPPRSARYTFLISWLIWLGYGLLEGLTLFMGGGIMLFFIDYTYLRYLSPAKTVQVIFRRLEWLGQRIFQLTPLTDTPYEFAAHLSQKLLTISTTAPDLRHLMDLYVQLNYGNCVLNSHDQQYCLQLWQQLRWQLFWAWLSKVKS